MHGCRRDHRSTFSGRTCAAIPVRTTAASKREWRSKAPREPAGHLRHLSPGCSVVKLNPTNLIVLTIALVLGSACQQQIARAKKPLKPPEQQTETVQLSAQSPPQLKLTIDGAVDQIGKTTSYDPSYQSIAYPNGDVPIDTGVCSDVIVRAFRKGGIDLQKDLHEDMKGNFSAYPTRWGLKSPDANIDHRRVPNLQTYFTRKGKSLSPDGGSDTFLPGDI
ncbi:MAG: uncharacterized protein QOK48_2223, partial [Blastocatellia bacterium]|nr:uncharacterized protein [Blastocatellia bacterium]